MTVSTNYQGITARRAGKSVESRVVYAGSRLLARRSDLRDYGDGPFDWGRPTDGALALALAMLADHFDDATAVEWHRAFCREVIAAADPRCRRWLLGGMEIDQWRDGMAIALIDVSAVEASA
jgi:hypothetical protein